MIHSNQPIDEATLDAIYKSDMCLEEKLSQHMSIILGTQVGYTWVQVAMRMIWAIDFSDKADDPILYPGDEHPMSTREKAEEFGLLRYTGQYLVPHEEAFQRPIKDSIISSSASLDQKLHWHRWQFAKPLVPAAVETMKQAIYLHAYGFDLESTMVQLIEGGTYKGETEMPLGLVIQHFHLEDYLLETEDNAYLRQAAQDNLTYEI